MNLDCKEVFEIVRQKLLIECPFSLIRFGDGEARTLSYLDDKDSAQFVMKRQFIIPLGFELIDHSFSPNKNEIKKDLKRYKGISVDYYYERITRIGNKPLHSITVLKKI